MKFAVIVFPGSNCDEDAYHAAQDVLGEQAEYIWHKDTDLKGADVVILPGGFAHGDYLRTGAMARFSPVMREVRGVRRARRPGPRHLQRLSDPARSRAAARGDAAEPRAEVPLRARASPRGADRHAVHVGVPEGPGAADADRARRRQLLRRAGRARADREQSPGDLPLHESRLVTVDRRRPIPTDRRRPSPACATRRGTWSG